MPRHPSTSPHLADLHRSVYSSLVDRLASHRGEIYPFHVGDTWVEPADGCRMQDLRAEEHPGLHRYAPPKGLPALVDAVVERVGSRCGAPVERAQVVISAGATGGLLATISTLLDPGEELLVLAPHWPLISGIARCARARPVLVPFHGDEDAPAFERLRRSRGPKTVAVYLATPNNPTGHLVPRDWLERIVAWARQEDLWIVSDEVYEDLVYRGEHVPCRALAPERCLSVHSFSKAFGMAGNRCGYVVGPPPVMDAVLRVSTHTIYNAPTAAQVAALQALAGRGDAWLERMRAEYGRVGERAARRLGVAPPEGSTFLFLDVADHLDERALAGFLERCVDQGLLLAPGTSFGPYPTHVRLCFTAGSPELVERGVERLAKLLGR